MHYHHFRVGDNLIVKRGFEGFREGLEASVKAVTFDSVTLVFKMGIYQTFKYLVVEQNFHLPAGYYGRKDAIAYPGRSETATG
jgi:hypothetical protein